MSVDDAQACAPSAIIPRPSRGRYETGMVAGRVEAHNGRPARSEGSATASRGDSAEPLRSTRSRPFRREDRPCAGGRPDPFCNDYAAGELVGSRSGPRPPRGNRSPYTGDTRTQAGDRFPPREPAAHIIPADRNGLTSGHDERVSNAQHPRRDAGSRRFFVVLRHPIAAFTAPFRDGAAATEADRAAATSPEGLHVSCAARLRRFRVPESKAFCASMNTAFAGSHVTAPAAVAHRYRRRSKCCAFARSKIRRSRTSRRGSSKSSRRPVKVATFGSACLATAWPSLSSGSQRSKRRGS